jgi:hypothetical protein
MQKKLRLEKFVREKESLITQEINSWLKNFYHVKKLKLPIKVFLMSFRFMILVIRRISRKV